MTADPNGEFEEATEAEEDDVRGAREEREARELEGHLHAEHLLRIEGQRDETRLPNGRTDLEREHFDHRRLEHERIVLRDIGENTVNFEGQQIVTLRIPDKLRRRGEGSRIPVRTFTKYQTGRYQLICEEGFFQGSYPHGELNAARKWSRLQYSTTGKGLSTELPVTDVCCVPVGEADPLETVSLSKAVQAIQGNRPPVSAFQRNGKTCSSATISRWHTRS